jgi:hypothetical protein
VTDVGDDATAALEALDKALESSIGELTAARKRVETCLAARSSGVTWRDIVTNQERPLVVESVTTVLDQLSAVGSRFRRAQAQALHREGLSMERVAELFGVTRQRVSALLRGRAVSDGRGDGRSEAGAHLSDRLAVSQHDGHRQG